MEEVKSGQKIPDVQRAKCKGLVRKWGKGVGVGELLS